MTLRSNRDYELEIDQRAERQLRRLTTKDYRLVNSRITKLAQMPRPPRFAKIRGDLHRIRAGDWRVFYLIHDDVREVIVTDVLRREKDTYDRV